MTMNPARRRVLNWFGGALAFAGVWFVGERLLAHTAQIDIGYLAMGHAAQLFGLALVYGSANSLLALAWLHLLRFLGASVPNSLGFRIYGISQLAKYVPGNIFQFAGRQALGLAAKVPGRILAKSVAWELGLISIAGVLFLALILPLVSTSVTIWISAGLFVLLAVVGMFAAGHWISGDVARAFAGQVLFLLVSGFVFVGTIGLVAKDGAISGDLYVPLCGAYVVAWLAGLVTPGAPAGLGVRESVVLLLVGGAIAEGTLIVGVLLARIVTVVGDTGFFTGAWSLTGQTELEAPNR